MAALERAEELADAVVHGPLDDPELGSLARQAAALRALDATFPLQSMTVELDLPADEEGVAGMGWAEMQRMAASLLGTPEVPPDVEG